MRWQHLLLVSLALAQRAAAEPEPSAADLFQQVSESVVVVNAKTPSGDRQGSGVVIASGLVVTNQHVVEGVTTARVALRGRTLDSTVRTIHVGHDLALLHVATGKVKPVKLRLSTSLRVGELAYAIGAPLGLENTLSEGVVSGLRPQESVFVVQTSAAISPGSSGGGLFDAKGQLIGITTRYRTGGQNLNFAVPTEWIEALRAAPPTAKDQLKARPATPAPKPHLLWEGIPDALADTLRSLVAKGEEVRHVAFTPAGGWVIIHGQSGYKAVGVPSTFLDALGVAAATGATLRSPAFSDGRWVFLTDKNGFRSEVSKGFTEALLAASMADEKLTSAALCSEGEVVIRGINGWWYLGVPEGMTTTLTRLQEANETIDFVTMRSDRAWMLVYKGGRGWWYGEGIPQSLLEAMQREWENGSVITGIGLAPTGGWVLLLR